MKNRPPLANTSNSINININISNNNNSNGIHHHQHYHHHLNSGNNLYIHNNNIHVQQLQQQQQQQQQQDEQRIVTEWEDNVLFDIDDPDFCNIPSNVVNSVLNTATVALNNLHLKVPTTATTTEKTTMSLASVHGPQQYADICSPLAHSLGMSASLPDLVGSPLEFAVDHSTMLTIEELRQHMGSCFTCGVSWTDDHVSLDCSECGGYSLERPCPLCDGECGVQWKRDFTMSHAGSKARWVGVCTSYPEANVTVPVAAAAAAAATSCASAAAAATQLRLAQELCSRLEQLSTSTGSTRI